ncbi:hypothetical protein ACJX0J_015226 [Zea mays]
MTCFIGFTCPSHYLWMLAILISSQETKELAWRWTKALYMEMIEIYIFEYVTLYLMTIVFFLKLLNNILTMLPCCCSTGNVLTFRRMMASLGKTLRRMHGHVIYQYYNDIYINVYFRFLIKIEQGTEHIMQQHFNQKNLQECLVLNLENLFLYCILLEGNKLLLIHFFYGR